MMNFITPANRKSNARTTCASQSATLSRPLCCRVAAYSLVLFINALFLLFRQALDLYDRPDFHRSLSRRRNSRGNIDCLVQVFGVDQEIPPELFPQLRKRAIRNQRPAIPHPHAGSRGRRLERRGTEIPPVHL